MGLRLLERLAVCVLMNEPVLLSGETGVGKTKIVQHLADLTGNTLVVQNMNQQSESGDMLGGFKPVSIVNLGFFFFFSLIKSCFFALISLY